RGRPAPRACRAFRPPAGTARRTRRPRPSALGPRTRTRGKGGGARRARVGETARACSDGGRAMDPVTFTTDDAARLEGELRMPEGEPRGTAVLCNPHPRHGGSKDHPLLWAIRNDLAATRRLAVLAFNFRGVMGSGGTYGGGRGEHVHVARA